MNDQTQQQQQTPCVFCALVESVVDWVKHPFNSQGSAFNWVLFVGLLIIAVWMWHVILLSIREEV